MSPPTLLFFKIALGLLCLLSFHINFRISLSILESAWILIDIMLYLSISLREPQFEILTVLSSGVIWIVLHSLSKELWHDVWQVVYHSSSLQTQHVPKFQTPKSKAGIQCKTCCLYRQFKDIRPSPIGLVGTLLKPSDASQGAALLAGLRIIVSDLYVNSAQHQYLKSFPTSFFFMVASYQ